MQSKWARAVQQLTGLRELVLQANQPQYPELGSITRPMEEDSVRVGPRPQAPRVVQAEREELGQTGVRAVEGLRASVIQSELVPQVPLDLPRQSVPHQRPTMAAEVVVELAQIPRTLARVSRVLQVVLEAVAAEQTTR